MNCLNCGFLKMGTTPRSLRSAARLDQVVNGLAAFNCISSSRNKLGFGPRVSKILSF